LTHRSGPRGGIWKLRHAEGDKSITSPRRASLRHSPGGPKANRYRGKDNVQRPRVRSLGAVLFLCTPVLLGNARKIRRSFVLAEQDHLDNRCTICDLSTSTTAKITVGYRSPFCTPSRDTFPVLDRVGVSGSVSLPPLSATPTSLFRHVNSPGGPASVEAGGSWGNGKIRRFVAGIDPRRGV
jgi:hypothetical protein